MKLKTAKKTLNVIYNQDARNILDTIDSNTKVTTTITSPPYYDMKDYDSDNQVGYGQTYEEYLNDLKSIFAGVFEITEQNGTLWIIIDTFKRNNQVITLFIRMVNKIDFANFWFKFNVVIII